MLMAASLIFGCPWPWRPRDAIVCANVMTYPRRAYP